MTAEQMGLGLGGPEDDGVHRLFFALWPEPPLRERIAALTADLEREHAPGGRRLKAERYHLTLQFLGDFQPLPGRLVADACAAADRVRVPAFDLALDCVGSFRGSDVWWLGSRAGPDGLQRLWDGLGAALAQTGSASRRVERGTRVDLVLGEARDVVALESLVEARPIVGGRHQPPGPGRLVERRVGELVVTAQLREELG